MNIDKGNQPQEGEDTLNYAAEAPDLRAVLQVVGRRADVALYDDWGASAPRTQIVAIGAVGSIDAPALREKFDACLTIL